MSEPIPESVPTSQDHRSHRPLKKRALTPSSAQSDQISALFANPDRATSPVHKAARTLAAPPEIVANVQGSSAGAGSGEFHVYKASRRREYDRIKAMTDEKEKEEKDAVFEAEREEAKKRDDEKTEKNRLKREKAKMRKMKKGGAAGEEVGDLDGKEDSKGTGGKGKLKPNVSGNGANGVTGGGNKGLETNGADGAQHPEEVGIVIHDDD